MTLRYLLGWLFIIAALGSAAMETAARGMSGVGGGWFIAAYDVWFAVWPNGLTALQAGIERFVFPAVWDPLVVTLLSLPGWLLFGVPGGVLIWRYHPLRQQGSDIDEDSYFLFDRLDKQAREEGEGDDPPNTMMPPPRFTDHHEAGDEEGESLPGPFKSLDLPGPDDDSTPSRGTS